MPVVYVILHMVNIDMFKTLAITLCICSLHYFVSGETEQFVQNIFDSMRKLVKEKKTAFVLLIGKTKVLIL